MRFLERTIDFFRAVPWRSMGRKARWLLVRSGILLGSLFLLMLVTAGFAGWYTSRPEFCNSCHIMEPYYQSWQTSSHADVSCVECHFPPGFGGKVRGKLLGLVQLAKYVTASAGPRPSAEIPDASCLRSGCHETRLLAGKVNFRGIDFDHTPHLGEMRRGKELRCTSCHSQIVQGQHMMVTVSTCFLCHFKDEPFNQGTGACMRCHHLPKDDFPLGGGVTFNHDMVYKQAAGRSPAEEGVKCVNCHGDVIRGKGEVPRERCLSCHNREGDVDKITDHQFMHTKHVTDHKVDCLQCHTPIEHSLDHDKIDRAASDCQACHPNQHHEQVAMLRGQRVKTATGDTNGMNAMRIECRTCHQTEERSSTGTILRRGNTKVCSLCHDAATVKGFEAYHVQLRSSLRELQSAIRKAEEALPAAGLADDRRATVKSELESAQRELDFLRTANDVHNMHYATKLNQSLVDRVTALCREVKVAEPKVTVSPASLPAGKPKVGGAGQPPAKK